MSNQLQFETSAYLLQHKENPVDWYPWNDKAINKAKLEDKPIFLSVGYSSCHWCHVMEKESFEDLEVAELLNNNFVNIKVDREERPDIDSIYMASVQILTGQGGWPMSVFLTPEGKPFYGGTYFPKNSRHGMPGFLDLIKSLSDIYLNKQEDILKSSEKLTTMLKIQLEEKFKSEKPDSKIFNEALKSLKSEHDDINGGFGSFPKFPQPLLYNLLLNIWNETSDEESLKIVTKSLSSMAKGGIYDHVGGGFHRYSTDSEWKVPHFEKMLYDNSLLSYLYLDCWKITKKTRFKEISENILDYLSKEMLSKEGSFFSSQDADSEGVEGKFFVWSKDEIFKILGKKDAERFSEVFLISEEGNFEGMNIILEKSNLNLSSSERKEINLLLIKLYQQRLKRIPPETDRKIITSWNSLAIKSFAYAGILLDREDFILTAVKSINNLLESNTYNQNLLRSSYESQNSDKKNNTPGFLEDYSFLIDALLEIFQVTGEIIWLEKAIEQTEKMINNFWDANQNSFFDTSKYSNPLILRPNILQDNVVPSGSSVVSRILIKLFYITNDKKYKSIVDKFISTASNQITHFPTSHAYWLSSLNMYYSTPLHLCIIGDSEHKNTKGFLKIGHQPYQPNRIIVTASNHFEGKKFNITNGKKMIKNLPTAYVCENYACKNPTNSSKELNIQLS